LPIKNLHYDRVIAQVKIHDARGTTRLRRLAATGDTAGVFLPAPARLLAAHRARESARRDAAFSDPYARVLLGAIDDRFSRILSGADTTEWLFTARTVAFDRLIAREVSAGVDLVVNLAAGLDARPYRLAFPAGLRWVDVVHPKY
jgi:O-methyltransferase involved in polyketide biosynthesis